MFFRILLVFVCLLCSADFGRAAESYFPIVAAGFTPGSSDQFYVTELVIRNSGLAQANASIALFSPQGGSFEATLRTASASGATSTQTADFFQMVIPP